MNIRKKCVNTSFVIFAKNRNGLTLVKNVSINELSEKPTNILKYLKNDSFEYFAIFEGNFYFFFFFFFFFFLIKYFYFFFFFFFFDFLFFVRWDFFNFFQTLCVRVLISNRTESRDNFCWQILCQLGFVMMVLTHQKQILTLFVILMFNSITTSSCPNLFFSRIKGLW